MILRVAPRCLRFQQFVVCLEILGLCVGVLYQFSKVFVHYLFIFFCPISFLSLGALCFSACCLLRLLGCFLCFPFPSQVFFTSCFLAYFFALHWEYFRDGYLMLPCLVPCLQRAAVLDTVETHMLHAIFFSVYLSCL